MEFPGTYEDEQGVEQITWRIEPVRRGYVIRTEVRGVPVSGHQLEGLERSDGTELHDCVLGGDMGVVRFSLDLRDEKLTLSDETRTVDADVFETGMQQLGVTSECCFTCLFSDYAPGGQAVLGMRCHRDVRERYLAVRSKADYWHVPVTQDVPETYLCGEYQRRIPGTGYRG
ncbi:hypothetical protein [Lentzea sp. CA-135723]|uniref:hypothetical protein n=1 Tax=Lentzea sp. CA-135723 TaxID=3239950 RepID=UPI003D94C640